MFFRMPFRRFVTLLAGLSPRSMFRLTAGDDLRTIDDPNVAERTVAALLR